VAPLNHPHIVTICSVEQADGQFFPTMELVEGRSLAEALPLGGLSLDRLLKIAIPVAEAMAAALYARVVGRRPTAAGPFCWSTCGRAGPS
jgi:hypothetical protein